MQRGPHIRHPPRPTPVLPLPIAVGVHVHNNEIPGWDDRRETVEPRKCGGGKGGETRAANLQGVPLVDPPRCRPVGACNRPVSRFRPRLPHRIRRKHTACKNVGDCVRCLCVSDRHRDWFNPPSKLDRAGLSYCHAGAVRVLHGAARRLRRGERRERGARRRPVGAPLDVSVGKRPGPLARHNRLDARVQRWCLPPRGSVGKVGIHLPHVVCPEIGDELLEPCIGHPRVERIAGVDPGRVAGVPRGLLLVVVLQRRQSPRCVALKRREVTSDPDLAIPCKDLLLQQGSTKSRLLRGSHENAGIRRQPSPYLTSPGLTSSWC
eukprot:m.113340 g.113340  ORF g.113340 m.113340 type:complete len:321 (+) comp21458_c0_seq1:1351-2313(+)